MESVCDEVQRLIAEYSERTKVHHRRRFEMSQEICELKKQQVNVPAPNRLPPSRRTGGPLMNRVHQPRPMIVLGLNAGMDTAAGAENIPKAPPSANAAAERRGDNLKGCTDFSLKSQARIWSLLSYMCLIRSTADG